MPGTEVGESVTVQWVLQQSAEQGLHNEPATRMKAQPLRGSAHRGFFRSECRDPLSLQQR